MTALGAVLAGGRSSRMGSDKAAIEISGRSLLERVSEALASVTPHVVVLGGDREGFETWSDLTPIPGPLTGVATALRQMTEQRALIVAVDNAFVRAATLAHLLDIASDLPVVPVDSEGVRQVTCAIYPKAIEAVAMEEAEAGGSIQTLLDRVSFLPVTPETWAGWGEDGRSWFSVDTPGDIATGLARFG